LKIVEELQDIDRRLIEWLMKEGLSPEEKSAIIEARADLTRASSRMLIAKILNPEDYKKLSEASMKEIQRVLKEKI
jgi:uncharacterized protein YfkK (UPF0435 family)